MVLGPPRSGKTTGLIIPNVLAANGAIVSTSTKPDVLRATEGARSRVGRLLLFDPTGSVDNTDGLEPLHWSPLQSCETWDGARAAARLLVDVGSTSTSDGRPNGDGRHWAERAEALMAPLLHAAALEGADMATVLTWVDRRLALPARQILAGAAGDGAALADNLLDGIAATDERELSGIWSTASGALVGFRSERALATTATPTFDAAEFVRSSDTIYVAAPAHRQALVAPMVVGLIEDVRIATYARSTFEGRRSSSGAPVLLALDEIANIAPLPDLPSMISEGGGQGLVTMACFQDLSQARHRWPGAADGFPSLFGTTVVLPGIGDVKTLEALSLLAGDEEIAARTVSAGRVPSGHPFADLVTGGRPQYGETAGTQWRRRLPPDVIGRGAVGCALAFDERNNPGWVSLTPSHVAEPWRSLQGAGRLLRRTTARIAEPTALRMGDHGSGRAPDRSTEPGLGR